MRGRDSSRQARTACLVALAVLAAALWTTLPGVALLVAPAVALFAVLLLGFMPGEQLLERMRARRFPRRGERAPRTLAIRHVAVVRRMTPPAASALAMRPPPAALALNR